MKNESWLIVIDGQDRTGKDTLMDLVEQYNDNFIIYKQRTCDDDKVDYRNKAQFEEYLKHQMQIVYDNIEELHQQYPNKHILTSRLWISDNVYSNMFGRKHITEKYFKEKFKYLFGGRILNYIIVWDSWNEFFQRMLTINDEDSKKEYSQSEFERIKDLFIEEADKSKEMTYLHCILNTTSRKSIYEIFINILKHNKII